MPANKIKFRSPINPRPCGSLPEATGAGAREQGQEMVDFFTEPITVYIDHAAEAKERVAVYLD